MSTDFSSDNSAFTCPECGSSYFSLLPGGVRQCNGQSSGGPGRCGWRSDGKSKRQLDREKVEASHAAGRMSDTTRAWRLGRQSTSGKGGAGANARSQIRRTFRLFSEGRITREDLAARITPEQEFWPEVITAAAAEYGVTWPPLREP